MACQFPGKYDSRIDESIRTLIELPLPILAVFTAVLTARRAFNPREPSCVYTAFPASSAGARQLSVDSSEEDLDFFLSLTPTALNATFIDAILRISGAEKT
jgi:hypothetical protein